MTEVLSWWVRNDAVGDSNTDIYLVKTDSLGNVQWERTYGGTGTECAYSISQSLDGGFVIAAYTTSYGAGGYDFYLIKTDNAGNVLWSRTYGGSDNEQPRCMAQTADGGYIIAGYTVSYVSYGWGIYLVKTDDQGDSLLDASMRVVTSTIRRFGRLCHPASFGYGLHYYWVRPGAL